MSQFSAFIDNYNELPKRSRYALIGGLLFIVLITIAGFSLYMKSDYAVLFSNLESQDASLIIKQLDKQKINYKVTDNGSSILVPKDIVNATRLKVMDTVPALSGGVGFEIFDKDNFGTTEFVQKINYQRALQGELARTIMSLTEVKFARVQLVLPTTSIFDRKDENSRASVTLTLKNGVSLTHQEVYGIQKLVASSTPGLQTGRVTILDQNGMVLSSAQTDPQGITAANIKLQMKKEVETYLVSKAQSILHQTLGTRNAHVSVDATLDFQNLNITREKVISPKDRNSDITSRKEIRIIGNKNKANDSSRSTIEVNYKLGKEVEHVVSTPGSIKKLSIAIVVPSGTPENDQKYIKDLIESAVGFDKSRGDQIALMSSTAAIRHNMTEQHPVAKNETAPMQGEIQAKGKIHSKNKFINYGVVLTRQLAQYINNNPFIILASVCVAGLILLLIILKSLFGSKKTKLQTGDAGLSDEERNQLLFDLKEWLAQESN